MDYYQRIQNAIEFIEVNLKEDMSIADIAANACFSAFHFQRLFQAISGFSVQEYIRKRRLTEAAVLLKETDKSILEVAVEFRYGSHEAFTRAFESQFGLSPVRYRREKAACSNYLAKINFLDLGKRIKGDLFMDKPEIVYLGKINIIGVGYKTNLNNEQYFNEIPGFYHDFGRNGYYARIPGRIAPDFPYGISCDYTDNGGFTFLVGEAASQPAETLEQGFMNFEIPEGRYAEFKIDGHAGNAQNTWRYIYGTWLPNSNYERREGPDFEVTDVCNSIYPDRMQMKIYIPIK